MIFEFSDELIRKGVYVDGSVTAKGVVVTGRETEIYEKVWVWLQEKALSPRQTTRFLQQKMGSLSKDEN